jgi:hypothetical protein
MPLRNTNISAPVIARERSGHLDVRDDDGQDDEPAEEVDAQVASG